MKKTALKYLAFIIPLLSFCQTPVTDAGANSHLFQVNQALLEANSKIMALENKVEKTNKELEKSNTYLEQLAELKQQEIDAYKQAPDNSLVQYQKESLFDEKQKMASQIKELINNLSDLKHLKDTEKTKIKAKYSAMMLSIFDMWTQTYQLLDVNDKIIPASERQNLLENTLSQFKEYLGQIERENLYLNMVNNRRKSRAELIGF